MSTTESPPQIPTHEGQPHLHAATPEDPPKFYPTGSEHRLRAGITYGAMAAWSHAGYLVMIGGGEAFVNAGVNKWAAAAAVAVATTAETFGMSHAATKGMGNFKFAEETKTGDTLRKAARLSHISSLWNGAPHGVMIDKAAGKEITTKRRLSHAVPYGVAVGAWVATPVPEFIAGEVVEAPTTVVGIAKDVYHEPVEAATSAEAVAVIGAAAIIAAVRKGRNLRAKKQ